MMPARSTWWLHRLVAMAADAQRFADPRRISEGELEDIRARDLLETEAPPLSGRATERAWRQAHVDRAALLAEVEALRGLVRGLDAKDRGESPHPADTRAAFANE